MRSKTNQKEKTSGVKINTANPTLKTFKLPDLYFQILIVSVFALVVGIGMIYHELWRDELEIYSRLSFTNNVLMEGDVSFICYYSILKLVMLMNGSETMFQIAHFIFIVAAIIIFVKFAKIPNLQKLLISLSYFIIFDYGIISRYYGFLILLLFLNVYFITRKEKNYLIIVSLLLILANHSIQSTIFSGAISLYLAVMIFNDYKKKVLKINPSFIISLVLLFAGWSAVLWFHYSVTLKNASYLGNGGIGYAPVFLNIKSLWNAFIPIPDLQSGVAFWNTNIVNYSLLFPKEYDVSILVTGPNIFAFVISLFFVLVICSHFADKPMVLIVYLLSTFTYLIFLEFSKVYFIRYQGLLFLIFISSYWMYKNSEDTFDFKLLKSIERFFSGTLFLLLKKAFIPMLYIILASQVFTAFYAFTKDIKYKFTYSQDAAKYILENNLNQTHVMVGYIDYATQSIAAHTKTKIFFPQVNHFNYYQEPFNTERKQEAKISEIAASCEELMENQDKKILLVLNFPLTDNKGVQLNTARLSSKSNVTFMKSFSGKAIQKDEQYWLYEVDSLQNSVPK